MMTVGVFRAIGAGHAQMFSVPAVRPWTERTFSKVSLRRGGRRMLRR